MRDLRPTGVVSALPRLNFRFIRNGRISAVSFSPSHVDASVIHL